MLAGYKPVGSAKGIKTVKKKKKKSKKLASENQEEKTLEQEIK